MGRPAVLKIDILADAKGAKAGISDTDSALDRMGKRAGKVGAAVGVGLAAAGAAAVAFGASSVKAFVEAETASARLDDALARFPATNDKTRASFDALNSSLALKTKFDDDATASGQAVLAQFKLTGSQIQDLTPLLQDYAAKTGKELPDAADTLGKALLGKGKALSEVGIKFKDAGSVSKNYEQIMGGLRTQVGGFAEKEGKTAAGQAAMLSNRFGEAKEAVGAKLLPALTALMTFVGSTLIPRFAAVSSELATRVGPALAQVGTFITTNVVPAATRLAGLFQSEVVPALRTVGEFVRANVLPAFQAMGAFVLNTVVPAFIRLAGPVIAGFRSALTAVGGAISKNREQLAQVGSVLQAVAGFALKLAPVLGTVLGGAFRVLGAVIGGTLSVFGAIVRAIDNVIGKIRTLARVAKTVGGALGGLNPFSAVPLGGFGPSLVGGYSGGTTGGPLTTAGLGDSGWELLARSPNSGLTIVDRRTIDARVTVNGALDPPSVARQLEQLLRDQSVRLGRATAFGTA